MARAVARADGLLFAEMCSRQAGLLLECLLELGAVHTLGCPLPGTAEEP